MGNTATLDYEKKDALRVARKQDFAPVQSADNYGQENRRVNALRLHQKPDNYPGANEDENRDGHGGLLQREFRERLERARQNYQEAKKLGGEAATLAKSATPWGMLSLLGQINILSDWTYGMALFAAIFKDLIDFIGIGSLPAIGTVITICTSIFIAFMMILGNIMQSEHDRTVLQSAILKKWGVLIVVTLVELFFGLNFIPAETIGVLLIYAFALAARKGRKEAAAH